MRQRWEEKAAANKIFMSSAGDESQTGPQTDLAKVHQETAHTDTSGLRSSLVL